jgi:hypothetical protein
VELGEGKRKRSVVLNQIVQGEDGLPVKVNDTSRADWTEVVCTVRAAAPSMACDGRPLRVIRADEDQDRLEAQVKAYWSLIIEPIAEQVWVDGRRFVPKAWVCQR